MTCQAATHQTSPTTAQTGGADADDAQIEALRLTMQQMLAAGNGDGVINTLLDIIIAQSHDMMRMKGLIEAAARARFGRKSEKLTPQELGQLALAFGASQDEAAQPNPVVPSPECEEEDATGDGSGDKKTPPKKAKKSRKGRHPGRTRLAPGLSRRIIMHPVPDCERDCIHCGTPMQIAGYLDHERVEYVPARIEVVVDRREKVACQACGQDITVAPRPGHSVTDTTVDLDPEPSANAPGVQPSDGANEVAPTHVYRRAGASLLAHLLEAKADDALPIYRQREQLSRLGFDVPLNTLYGYWDAAATIIQPVAQVVLSAVLGDPIVGVDDTKLDWLDPAHKSRRQRGHLWCFTGTTPLVAFEFTKTWCAEDVAPWISAIDGFIQCDDYKGYGALMKQADGTKAPLVPTEVRLGCWMHLRRPFYKALKAGEKLAAPALTAVKQLYAVEATARDKGMTPDQRHELRQQQSLPVAEELFVWLNKQQPNVRPKSYFGQALHYAVEQKEFVMRCLSDGRFELDTGRVERQIREPVIGRKNFLFSGSAEAARRLAGVYTLVCSCRNLHINTRDYLVDIITKLQAGFPLRHVNRLRPDIWAAGRQSLVAYQMGQQAAEKAVAVS